MKDRRLRDAREGSIEAAPVNYADGGFSLEGFIKQLVRWIVVDDQVRQSFTLLVLPLFFS